MSLWERFWVYMPAEMLLLCVAIAFVLFALNVKRPS